MATTPNLGLHYYGGDVPGSITDEGSKHTGADRLYLDQVITQLALAPRHYIPPVVNVATSFGLDYETVGGTLADGTTYYYRVSLIGLDGFERVASDEISMVMPDLLAIPRGPGLRDAPGGTLTQGLYFYALTARNETQESVLSAASSVNVYPGINQAIYVDAPVDTPDGVTLQVWRKKDVDGGFTRLGTITDGGTYTDDGSIQANQYALDPAYAPPVTNRGNASNSIIVTLVGDAATAATSGQIAAWRIYRTTVSGYYGAQSLVHEVVERDAEDGDPDGPLRTSWVDTGDALRIGAPQFKDRSLRLTPWAPQTVDALPTDVSAYPANYLLVFGNQLYILREGVWTLFGGGMKITFGLPYPSDAVTGDLNYQTALDNWYRFDGTTWQLVIGHEPSLLSGEGAPEDDTGRVGDFWLDTAATPAALYGPRGSTWPEEPVSFGGGTSEGSSPILTSPNGTRYRQVVDDDGNVTTEATLEPGPPAVVTNPVLED